jgi:hypothetical protein
MRDVHAGQGRVVFPQIVNFLSSLLLGFCALSIVVGCASQSALPDASDISQISDDSMLTDLQIEIDQGTDIGGLHNPDSFSYGDVSCPPRVESSFCSDGNPCTTDKYDVAASLCQHIAIAGCERDSCTYDGDCAHGVCDPTLNVCVPCTPPPNWSDELSGSGCGKDERCVRNECRPAAQCVKNTDCASTKQFCQLMSFDTFCVDCRKDADCGDCARCVTHSCVPLEGVCSTTKPCEEGFHCTDFRIGECTTK